MEQKKNIILFTNTYPYGSGESFLHTEIPFLAQHFGKIIIRPLYIQKNGNICRDFTKVLYKESEIDLSGRVIVEESLLPFDHKAKWSLLFRGLFNFTPIKFAIEEFISRKVWNSGLKFYLFMNYLLILRAILSNRRAMKEICHEISDNGCLPYFYWGDKSALAIPFIKGAIAKMRASKREPGRKMEPVPPFVIRLHGSDLYEEAKGFLPFREMLYKAADYAVTISENGAEYIRTNYRNQPANIIVSHLGSFDHNRDCPNLFPYNDITHPTATAERIGLEDESESGETGDGIEINGVNAFNIVSCSNVIELKRVELIAVAMLYLENDAELSQFLKDNGVSHLTWTHIGDGPLLQPIKQLVIENSGRGNQAKGAPTGDSATGGHNLNEEGQTAPNPIIYRFPGAITHNQVLDYYQSHYIDLFLQVSRSEGIPVSIMEALSYGIPVIATDVGGVGEIIAGEEYGKLLPKEVNGEIIATAIKEWIMKKSKTNSSIAARKAWEERWNSTKNFTGFSGMLHKIASGGQIEKN